MAYPSTSQIDPADIQLFADQVRQNKAPRTFLINEMYLNPTLEKTLSDYKFLPAGKWMNMYAAVNNSNLESFKNESIIELKADDSESIKVWTGIVSQVLFSKKPLNSNIFTDGLKKGSFRLFLTTVDGIGVCTGLLYLNNIPGVYMIATLPEHRKKGYGRRLMQKIMKAAGDSQNTNIVLQSTSEGAGLYESLGFVNTGNLFLYYSILK